MAPNLILQEPGRDIRTGLIELDGDIPPRMEIKTLTTLEEMLGIKSTGIWR